MVERISRTDESRSEHLFRWPESVPVGAILVCGDSEVAAVFGSEKLIEVLDFGEHEMSAAAYPFLEPYETPAALGGTIRADLWFASLDPHPYRITGSLGEVEEGEHGVAVTASFEADILVRITDARRVLEEHSGDPSAIPAILEAQLARILRLTLRRCFQDDKMSFYELDDQFFEEAAHVEVLPALRKALIRHGLTVDDLKVTVEPDANSRRRLDAAAAEHDGSVFDRPTSGGDAPEDPFQEEEEDEFGDGEFASVDTGSLLEDDLPAADVDRGASHDRRAKVDSMLEHAVSTNFSTELPSDPLLEEEGANSQTGDTLGDFPPPGPPSGLLSAGGDTLGDPELDALLGDEPPQPSSILPDIPPAPPPLQSGPPGSGFPAPTDASGPNVGARVRAQAGQAWFDGVVVVIHAGQCLVRWDGAPATWVASDDLTIETLGTGTAPPDPEAPKFFPGTRVLCEYGDGNQYPATILRFTSGWYEVEWEAGSNAWLPGDQIRAA